jgi:hypothetical protein
LEFIMRGTPPGIVAVVLALGVVLPSGSASAQSFQSRRWYDGTPVRQVQYETSTPIPSEGYLRLEEMKVEIALLADLATFPCYFAPQAAGGTLGLRGFVPNVLVRQRALDIARRSTFLAVRDELIFQPQQKPRPSPRSVEVLQEEAIELLSEKLGPVVRDIGVVALPNGTIVLMGEIESVEAKLEISRVLRQLPDCWGAVNVLTPKQVLRDGQRLVQVTRDGSTTVSPSALGQEFNALGVSSVEAMTRKPAPLPKTPPPIALAQKPPAAPAPKAISLPPPPPPRGFDALDGDLRLPRISPAKVTKAPVKTEEKKGTNLEALTPPQLPAKWGRPARSERAVERVEKRDPPSANAVPRSSPLPTISAPKPLPAPARVENKNTSLEALTPPQLPSKWGQPSLRWKPPEPKRPASPPSPTRSVETRKPALVVPNKPSQSSVAAPPAVKPPPKKTAPAMTWHRPSGSEESEPQAPAARPSPPAPNPVQVIPPRPPSRSTTAPIRPSLHWPPAYAAPASESNGRAGTITFDDPPPPPVSAPKATAAPIVPANLQRQVKSVCGRQARDVLIQRQPDGSFLVRVKVPDLSASDQLTRKILAIPDMTAPNVRLMMDVGP